MSKEHVFTEANRRRVAKSIMDTAYSKDDCIVFFWIAPSVTKKKMREDIEQILVSRHIRVAELAMHHIDYIICNQEEVNLLKLVYPEHICGIDPVSYYLESLEN